EVSSLADERAAYLGAMTRMVRAMYRCTSTSGILLSILVTTGRIPRPFACGRSRISESTLCAVRLPMSTKTITNTEPTARIWVHSDLQLAAPAVAEEVLATARDDVLEFGIPLDAIWCL